MADEVKNGVYMSSASVEGGWDKAAEDAYHFYVDGVMTTADDVRTLRAQFMNRGEQLIFTRRQLEKLRNDVHKAIADAVSNNELERDVANEMLDDLRLDRLAVEYEWRIQVDLTGTAESVLDADSFADWLRDNIAVEASLYTNTDVSDFSQDNTDITDVAVEEA